MSLEMRSSCERCSDEMERVCPNCGGELVARPKRGADVSGALA